LQSYDILIAIPSLHGGPMLHSCLASLAAQTERDFEVIVVDNSGIGAIAAELGDGIPGLALRVHISPANIGFAAAINQAWAMSRARYLATLNDDAEADPGWLAALKGVMDLAAETGMCASQVRLYGAGRLDSAGMLLCPDGSSKQRGHGRPPSDFSALEETLFPSASAALYRREMLEDVGLFDPDLFLYCEDTDLGLRARWNGWRCMYVPQAIVFHHYSRSAGAASPLKAWYIERNRLWVAAKTFPTRMLWALPFHSAARYLWHLIYLLRGRGAAARFQSEGRGAWALPSIALRAHWTLVASFRDLRRKRREIRKTALLTPRQFLALMKRYRISTREIARL
jgi:GT2 family glycosyltransferase